jgi:transcriptional regulator with XRE-family HTH domain
VDAELIRRTRRASKLTQESLSEDICTQETLARIENGNQQPRSEKLWQIMEKMDRNGKRIETGIQVEEYEILKSETDNAIDDRDMEENDNYRYYNNNGYGAWLESLNRDANQVGFGAALDKFKKITGRDANKKEYHEIANAFHGITK